MILIFRYKADNTCPSYTPPLGDAVNFDHDTNEDPYTPLLGDAVISEFCDPNA